MFGHPDMLHAHASSLKIMENFNKRIDKGIVPAPILLS